MTVLRDSYQLRSIAARDSRQDLPANRVKATIRYWIITFTLFVVGGVALITVAGAGGLG